jgi:hypothetical protein
MPYLYSNIEIDIHMLCGEGQWLGSVDCNDLLILHIISRTSRHLKNVVVRHLVRDWGPWCLIGDGRKLVALKMICDRSFLFSWKLCSCMPNFLVKKLLYAA